MTAYASWSVVFGEQPSAAKWNILGTNDSSFNDSTGINLQYNNLVGLSNPYKCSVYRNAAASTGNGAFAKITFDSELYDTNNNFASGTYTAPVAGFYQFNARFSVSTSHTRIIIQILVNGVGVLSGVDISSAAITNGGVTVSSLVQLAATNTVDIHAFGSATLSIEVGQTSCWMNGFLVSKT